MKRISFFVIMVAVIAAAGCNKPFVKAKASRDLHFYDRTFEATPNQCYYALRWALKANRYTLAKENLMDGILTTTWQPVSSDSHYLPLFNREDYGVTGAYHQLEVHVVPVGSKTRVDVASRVKSVVANITSSGVEEHKVLAAVGDYLRSKEPDITNEGIAE